MVYFTMIIIMFLYWVQNPSRSTNYAGLVHQSASLEMPVRFRYSALNNFRVWSNWLRLYIWSVGIVGSSPTTLRVSRSKTSTWWNLGNANLLQFDSRIRDVVQLARMLHLGCSGRAFESRYPDKNIIWPVWCNWLACNTVNIADGVRISNVALLLLIYKEKIIF